MDTYDHLVDKLKDAFGDDYVGSKIERSPKTNKFKSITTDLKSVSGKPWSLVFKKQQNSEGGSAPDNELLISSEYQYENAYPFAINSGSFRNRKLAPVTKDPVFNAMYSVAVNPVDIDVLESILDNDQTRTLLKSFKLCRLVMRAADDKKSKFSMTMVLVDLPISDESLPKIVDRHRVVYTFLEEYFKASEEVLAGS
ncbi:MAG: hypothetical protein K2X81_16325 [Candidatus Obscuribacterales bacterium]|nr:hypothetical protein [Candidatus Obscuribacterales bacterium]